VVIGGDAGVGKTRLLSEVIRLARADGACVLLGHCLHFGGDAVPYLPISEAFGRLARDEPDLVDELRADLPPIDRLLPQRRLIGAEADAPRPVELADLFAAVLAALVRLSETRPVVFVLEDVHWADTSTRDLIGFLFARTLGERVTVVVSYRADDLHRRHPLRPALVEWARIPGVVRLPLLPLADDGMRRLIHARHPQDISEAAVSRILDRAGGNAFYAEQLVAETDGSDHIPADLAELLLHRLERLDPAARRVARAAAVSGRRISHSMLAAVAGLDDRQLDDALREAVDERILDRTEGDGYAFRHALLAEAIYDDLLPGERVRLHRTFATALAAGQVRGTEADLARHAREAMDLPLALAAGVRAGNEALRVGAPSEAMGQFESALELIDALPEVERNTQRPGLVLAAAEAAVLSGHSFRALNLIQDALDTLPASTQSSNDGADAEARADLLIALAVYALPLDSSVDFFAATSEALRLVPDQPTPRRALALAAHARSAAELGRDDDAAHRAQQAHALGVELDLKEVVTDAATTLARLDARAEDPDRVLGSLRASIEQAEAGNELGVALRGLFLLGNLQYDRGEIDEALATYSRAVDGAEAGHRPWAAYARDSRDLAALTHYVRGDWDRVAEVTRTDDTTPAFAEAGLTAVGLAVRAARGDVTALDDLDRLRPWWNRDGLVALHSAGPGIDLLASMGRFDDAVALHDDVVAVIGELWQNEWFQARIRLHTLALGALAASVSAIGSSGRAAVAERGRQLVADVSRTAERGSTRQTKRGPEGMAWLARADAEWARLRWLSGVDPPTAEELVQGWERSVAAFDYGHVFERARSLTRLAAARRAVGDAAGAQRDADEARAVARRLEAQPLLDELRELGAGGAARAARAARTRGTSGQPDGGVALTAREEQVLSLIAQGRTNRQIGRALFISDKTVSVHVSNILAKLGAGGRTEAAAIARRDGLLT
jgi:DNA-binding CsgD family transcriptional regulator/tetratricopeptide (TPR) repeat protein